MSSTSSDEPSVAAPPAEESFPCCMPERTKATAPDCPQSHCNNGTNQKRSNLIHERIIGWKTNGICSTSNIGCKITGILSKILNMEISSSKGGFQTTCFSIVLGSLA